MKGAGAERSEAGYSMIVLMASVAIMLILLGAATPGWRYLTKNDREEELIFRGGEIADGIQRFQRKNGNALPASLDVLVKGKFLRKAYKDPMVPDGKWRFLRPGEAVVPGASPGTPGRPGPVPTPTPTPPATSPGSRTPGDNAPGSPIQGVASRSTDRGLRIFNGRERYSEWVFVPGQPRVIGRPMAPAIPGIVPTPRPGTTPAPTPPTPPPTGPKPP